MMMWLLRARRYQIEAGFHFKVNGEYYGGYLRSVAMTHHEAEMKAKGEPKVNVRYNPANPDKKAVLPEDNSGGPLPFRRFISGLRAQLTAIRCGRNRLLDGKSEDVAA